MKKTVHKFTATLAIVALVVFAFSQRAYASTFGYTTEGSNGGFSYGVGNGDCSYFIAPGNGNVTQMSVYFGLAPGTENANVAIYLGTATSITTLVASGSGVTLSGLSSWQNFTISSSITSGTGYWLCWQGTDNTIGPRVNYDTGLGSSFNEANNVNFGGGSYNTWNNSPGGSYTNGNSISIYAIYTPSASTPISGQTNISGGQVNVRGGQVNIN